MIDPKLQTDELTIARKGRAVVMTLNRPAALNALTHAMVRAYAAVLDAVEHDPAIDVVVVRGAGDRAFSAGGDIRDLYEQGVTRGLAGAPEQLGFFVDEYRLNHRCHAFPKPIVALIDGIVMGGGVGVSFHGRHRVGTEKTAFAMPEVGIGFFPDVGATWCLPRLPHGIGTWLALSGERVRAADCRFTGLTTHTAASADLDRLEAALCETGRAAETLAAFDRDPGPAPLAPLAATIDRLFAGASVEEILSALDAEAEGGRDEAAAFAARAARTIRTKSPTSLAVALRQMRTGRDLSFAECMRVEYRIVCRILAGHDFYEGVRSVIIDKDGAPRWRPSSVGEVDPAEIARHFAPAPGGDLVIEE